jgi:regulator of protease activity HflC (stomatin/prohibitin superfamily)
VKTQLQGWQTTVALTLVGILAIIGLNAFVIINPGEAGVLSILGKAQDGALLEGIHVRPPLFLL